MYPTRTDTAVFVFSGDTVVKRVSPNPVTFGYTMYNTLVGEMHMSLVRKNLANRAPVSQASLPGRPTDPCNKRP